MRLKLMRISAAVLLVFMLLMTGVTSGTVYAFDNNVKEGAGEAFPVCCSRRIDETDSGPKTGMESFYAGRG